MIRFFLFIIGVLVVLSCERQREFTINGEIDGLDDEMVYLLRYEEGERRPVDSTRMQGGRFSFNGSVDVPQFYHIGVEGFRSTIEVFLENSEIEVESSRRNIREANVEGSSVHDEYDDFKMRLIHIDLDINDVENDMEYLKRWGHDEQAEKLRKEQYEPLLEKRQEFLIDYVESNTSSHVAAFVLYHQLMYALESEKLEELLDSFDNSVADSPYLSDVEQEIENLKALAPGEPYRDFEMASPQGDTVSLSSFVGEGYLLVDFTASWSETCRRKIPELIEIHEKYGDRGLDIVSVSLDHDRQEWISFIEEEGLNWDHMSDLKQWESEAVELYVVRSIPHRVLIAPDGTIVSNGFDSTEELDERLAGLI